MSSILPVAFAMLLGGAVAGVAAAAAPGKELEAGRSLAASHCAVCHTFEKGAPPGQGPNLFGIVGRKAGAAEGFAYSESFKKALASRSWDPQLLDRWLTDTQVVAPGSAMTYFQDDPKKRKRLIAFLASLR